MAHKNIYVCDGCGSYVDYNKDLHTLQIKILPTAGTNHVQNPIIVKVNDTSDVRREICRGCAARLIEDFKLSIDLNTLVEDAFRNFSIPSSSNDPTS